MIIKPADTSEDQQRNLRKLLEHPSTHSAIKPRIEQQLRKIQAGILSEQETSHEMQLHFGVSPDWMIIHDLRIEHDGEVAQIDHLIMNRCIEIWLCESKHFSEGVSINDYGEFTAFYKSKPYAVTSPIAQNNKHIIILKRLFESRTTNLPTKNGFSIQPDLKSLVLISKGARVTRPKVIVDGIDTVIKTDRLFKTIDSAFEQANPSLLAKRLVSSDTLETFAKSLASLHKPLAFNWSPNKQILPSSTPP